MKKILFLLLVFGCSNQDLVKRIDRIEQMLNEDENKDIVSEPGFGLDHWNIPFEGNGDSVEEAFYCSQCKREGLKSIVYVGMTTCTLIGFTPYYDEDGVYHYEDPNTCTTEYQCSNGHSWEE